MRGISAEQYAFLSKFSARCGTCSDACLTRPPVFLRTDALADPRIRESLLERGLIATRDCERRGNNTHVRRTPLGTLALLAYDAEHGLVAF